MAFPRLSLDTVFDGASVQVVADCIFCRIVAGEVPADVVASNEGLLAFRDMSPGAPVHVLIVPRNHIQDVSTIQAGDRSLLAGMLEMANVVAKVEQVQESGFRLVFNVGEDAGNSVPHLHLHVLGGRRLGWPPG